LSRRDQIKMTATEIAAFLDEQRKIICASNGRSGWPHLMPLWYVVRGGELWAWTYAKSQKVLNLERDNRATVQIEAGERYDELRGLMIQATTEIHRDMSVVAAVGTELAGRYGETSLTPDAMDAIRAKAAKRVALRFVAQTTASWDHRKLKGS
jgi:general stress protein 26